MASDRSNVRVALVTGASRGLGLEFVRQLLERGDRVFACARAPESSVGLLGLREHHGDRLSLIPLDVGDAVSIDALHATVAARTDHLDLLVNNAGINSGGVPERQRNLHLGELEAEGILRMVRINAVGPVLVTQALVDLLANASAPRVLHVSSWLGSIERKRSGGNYGYCASKATLNMLGRALAFDLLDREIVSVLVNPGWVRTDMGGHRAELTAEASVAGMLQVAASLHPSDAGSFRQWDGSALAF